MSLSMGGYSFLGSGEDIEQKTEADDKSPPQPDTAKTETKETPADKPEPQPEPISESLAGRARALGISEAEMKEYGAPADLERHVTLIERNLYRARQQEQQKPTPSPDTPEANAKADEEEDWAGPILKEIESREYGEELTTDLKNLVGSYKGQLSKRDETIKEMRDTIGRIENYLVTQDHHREVGEFDTWLDELISAEPEWSDVYGKGKSFDLVASKAPGHDVRNRIFDAATLQMQVAAASGQPISRKEAARRAHLIEMHAKAAELAAKKADKTKTETKTDAQLRDAETGQFIARANRSNGQRPKTEDVDKEAAYFDWKKKRGI
jgi:hypothetical protein